MYQVQPILELVANKLPFAAKVVSQQMMEEMAKEEERLEKENLNRYTFKYVIQNNLGGCHNWISPYDKKWFGKHL
jgi:large subunit ribosomal protein L16